MKPFVCMGLSKMTSYWMNTLKIGIGIVILSFQTKYNDLYGIVYVVSAMVICTCCQPTHWETQVLKGYDGLAVDSAVKANQCAPVMSCSVLSSEISSGIAQKLFNQVQRGSFRPNNILCCNRLHHEKMPLTRRSETNLCL